MSSTKVKLTDQGELDLQDIPFTTGDIRRGLELLSYFDNELEAAHDCLVVCKELRLIVIGSDGDSIETTQREKSNVDRHKKKK